MRIKFFFMFLSKFHLQRDLYFCIDVFNKFRKLFGMFSIENKEYVCNAIQWRHLLEIYLS